MIKQVVSEYADGVSATRLAMRYGIGKGTLLRLIRESGLQSAAGVQLRSNKHEDHGCN
jgi:hypothetical protein